MYTPNEFQTQLFDEIFGSTKGKRKITAELMEVLGCSELSVPQKNRYHPIDHRRAHSIGGSFFAQYRCVEKECRREFIGRGLYDPSTIKGYDDIDFYLDNTRRNLNQAVNVPALNYILSQKKFLFIATWTGLPSVPLDFIYGTMSTCAETTGLTFSCAKHAVSKREGN